MTPSEMEKLIKKDGWRLVAVEGSHHQYRHPTKKGKVTIAFHSKPKDLKPRAVKSILKQAGLDRPNHRAQ
ncbi:MAG: type II toxin-antitoxin system HicA family toxin [Schwartzia sp.]|nr:type II toxin-antitoxin system HicA family toxin [Schwartzia sp. (in: firmicutes)]